MDQLPALAIALPLLVAAILMGAAPLLNRRALDILATTTALVVLTSCVILTTRTAATGPIVAWLGNWPPRGQVAIGIALVVDPLGAGLAALAATLTTASLVFSWRYFDAVKGLYHALMLVFLAAMVGFCLTGDLFNLFVFFELMSVAAFALTAYKVEDESLEGALNFAVVNSVGAFLVLSGIGLLYGRTGALNLAQIGQTLGDPTADWLPTVALVLIASGFLAKAAMVPFHFWLADAHAVAPTPACVLFSGVMVELGLYAVARVEWSIFEGHPGRLGPAFGTALIGFGTATALIGGIMCTLQRHLKRLLAFSTIGHVGMILIGLGLRDSRALAGVAVYVLGHGCVKGALFLGAGVLLHRRASVDIGELRGQGRDLRWTGLAVTLAALGLAGLPPFGTATGKAQIEAAARLAGHDWVILVLIACSALTAGAVLKVAGSVFLGWGDPQQSDQEPATKEGQETGAAHGHTPGPMFGAIAVLVVLGLAAGIAPRLSTGAAAAAARFTDRGAYESRVLSGHVDGPPTAEGGPVAAVSVGTSLATLAATLAVAGLGLFGSRLPGGLRLGLDRMVGPGLAGLRGLHSGRVGDYVAWLVVGVATLGGVVAMLISWRGGR